MIFDWIAPDRVSVDACARLGARLPKAAADRPNHSTEAVKRKSERCGLLMYPSAYSYLSLPRFLYAGIFAFVLSQNDPIRAALSHRVGRAHRADRREGVRAAWNL